MPRFPTYHGQVPQRLNPLDVRHYLLLAYWIYFRPTALKHYLYQAAPEIYQQGPMIVNFRQTWRVPAYRSLYLMIVIIALLLPVLVMLLVVLVSSWTQGTPVNWAEWGRGALGAVVAVIIGGLAGSVALIVAGSVVFGVVLGLAVGVAVGAAGGLASGTISGLAFGLLFGVTVGAVFGTTVGVAGGIVVGLFFAATGYVAGDVAFGLAFGLGAFRLLFYPFQLAPALWSLVRDGKHPLEWDELLVLPLPGSRQTLIRRLQANEANGLRLLADTARNPFQRWAVQRVLWSYLHRHPTPLRLLYALLARPGLRAYIFAPVSKEDWDRLPTMRQLLLNELNVQWVDCSTDPINRFAERLIWGMTWPFRKRRRTPLTRFAEMLNQLLAGEAATATAFDLSPYKETVASLEQYPGGLEILRSFEALAAFQSYGDLPALASAQPVVSGLAPDGDPIRPQVLAALIALGDVGVEVAAYRQATSRVNQLAALARAIDALDDLDEFVLAEVMAPEQAILRGIIRHWRRLVSDVGGEVGRVQDSGLIANPYVVGNPVSGHLFVGREDVLRRLEELWLRGDQGAPSVVLYGQRRMGKSSILQNLGARFGARTVVVDFNMQRVGLVGSTGELLYNLALAMYDAWLESGPGAQAEPLAEPGESSFVERNPYTALDRFLKQLNRVRAGRRFIVAVDEFELIEQMITAGRLEPELLHFWRGLIQTYPWLLMAFAGLHTLQDMTRDYWHPLFGSVTSVPVSYLSPEAARRLILNPDPDFALDYDPDAVEQIVKLTHGQPYLIQLIGHTLVARFNRQAFEEGLVRKSRLTLPDVEAVISAPEFYRDGDAYFTGVWRQVETSQPAGQAQVLRALAHSEAGLTPEQILDCSDLAPAQAEEALSALVRHDVVRQVDGRWGFTVELMRRWVEQGP
ncbi:MAG: hypothetical protein ACE5H9_11240 [Anaerolineae bacterium]